ncbi:hypothetical protein D0Y65_013488, partial [Glycine soja]
RIPPVVCKKMLRNRIKSRTPRVACRLLLVLERNPIILFPSILMKPYISLRTWAFPCFFNSTSLAIV